MENKFKGQALNVRVVVKDIEIDNKNSFGVDLSSSVEKNGYQKAGIVVSVGELTPKLDNGKHTLNIGDTILYDKTRMTALTLEGEKYTMLNYVDIFAKI
jgi:co-chaperonin GroES (HSP10)